ncbi:glycosyltransferase family 39 protein [uncultured Proteiniphilum sp.]|uniref:ArnT family glycosyltransferase n=1 Tax=uncultured Proteiniphilum sp. TaxID=497637 RepID=UPI00260B54D6|nr:glycosyltransferase family 39 protein [uncultured Proteiniphilum sp.]
MKNNWIYVLIVGVLFTLIYTMIFDAKLDLNGDNAHYLTLAKNISGGLGYSNVTPNGTIPASHFPPGYSAFLSVFMLLGIHSLVFFKVLNGILFFISLAGIFYLLCKITSNQVLAFVCTLLAVFSPQALQFSSMVMSEMLFLFCSVVCLYALYKYCTLEKGISRFRISLWLCTVIVFAACAYYVRAAGIALIFAIVIFFLFRKQWLRGIAVGGGILLLLLPWWIRNRAIGIESRYFGTMMTVNPWRPEEGSISSVGEFIRKMIANFDETVIKGFKEILFPFIPVNYEVNSGIFQIIAGLLLLGIILYGAWNLKPLKWVFIAYLLGQIGLFMLWHGGNESRYVVPIAPFIIVCFYIGLYCLVPSRVKGAPKTVSYLPYVFLVMVFLLWPPIKTLSVKAKDPYPPAFANYFTMAIEMQKQLPKNTVCCCRKPEFFTYFAPDLYAINYLYSIEPQEVIKDLIDKNVEYVVLEQLGYASTVRYLYPAILANEELFELVWRLPNPDTYLFKFNREQAIKKLAKSD